MSLIKDIVYYFSVYRKYLGYRLYITFLLAGLAAAAEAFGIALILPLIEIAEMDLGDSETSTITLLLQNILSFIGIGHSMIGILIFIGVIFFMKGIIIFAEGSYNAILQSNLQRELKRKVFNYYSNMNYRYYSNHNTGHFLNILGAQIYGLIRSFENFKKFISEAIIALIFIIIAFMISWRFASMAVSVGIVIMFLFKSLNAYVKKLSKKTVKEQSLLNKFLVQTFQSWKYITSTSQTHHLSKGVFKSIFKLTSYMRKQGVAGAFTTSVKEPASILLIILIIIIQLIIFNAPLAPIFVSLILIHRSMGHVMAVQVAWQKAMSAIGSLEMIESEMGSVVKYQEKNGIVKLPIFKNFIDLKNISFSYNENESKVLDCVNLNIEANTTVAFVGDSGAGKSTLVDMLTLMLRPDEGQILIDGISHSDIELSSWRTQIGYVSQDTVVFDDTIANNICMWTGDYNNDDQTKYEVELAAERAFALEFINNMPKRFNTIVGDRGIRLSGGQKQRLFIARELYKKPRFLILDEATSALDSESEKFIRESIDNLKGSTTVVIIAHRLSTIRNADYIYVLDKGNIIERGTYTELMNSGKNFFKMVELQTL